MISCDFMVKHRKHSKAKKHVKRRAVKRRVKRTVRRIVHRTKPKAKPARGTHGNRKVHLVCISKKPYHNKFYKIQETSAGVKCDWGPIGGWMATQTYPKGTFDKILRSKLAKGYKRR